MRIVIALALSLMGSAAMAEDDIVLRGMGSFHIGGDGTSGGTATGLIEVPAIRMHVDTCSPRPTRPRS